MFSPKGAEKQLDSIRQAPMQSVEHPLFIRWPVLHTNMTPPSRFSPCRLVRCRVGTPRVLLGLPKFNRQQFPGEARHRPILRRRTQHGNLRPAER